MGFEILDFLRACLTLKRKYKILTLTKTWGQRDPKAVWFHSIQPKKGYV